MSYTLIVLVKAVLTPGRFLADNTKLSFLDPITTNAFLAPTLSSIAFTFLVLISSNLNSSITTNLSACTLDVNADFKAIRLSFLFNFFVYSLGVGANTTPPPFHCGARIDPCLA